MAKDVGLLQAALIGLQVRKAHLEAVIAGLQKQVIARNGAGGSATATKVPQRGVSAAAWKRMAEAQKKRWAEYRAAKGR